MDVGRFAVVVRVAEGVWPSETVRFAGETAAATDQVQAAVVRREIAAR